MGMNKKIQVGIILAIIAAAGVSGYYLSKAYVEPNLFPGPPGGRPSSLNPNSTNINRTNLDRFDWEPEDRDNYIAMRSVISFVNMAIAGILIAIYISIYRETHSEFSLSLIVVTASLLVYAITSNPIIPQLFGYRMIGFGAFTFIPDLCSTVAMSILLYMSLK